MPDTPDAQLGEAIAQLLRRVPDARFLQIGGFDGESFDPLRPHIIAHNLAGLIVEPVPLYFEKLRALYAGSDRVLTANYAVAADNGERTLWCFNPEAVTRGLVLPHFAGISSFVMEDLLSDSGVLGRSSPNAETTALLRKLVQPVTVQCRTAEALLREFGLNRVDILQIDTEGYDYEILKVFDFARYRPAVVHYEHQHLSAADSAAAARLLAGHGYRIVSQQYDTLAVMDAPLHNDIDSLRQRIRALDAGGQTLEAMQALAAYQAAGCTADFTDDIRILKLRAFAAYNAHRNAGQIDQAEPYAAALAALLPDHMGIAEAAFECNRALGRYAKTAEYAIALLNADTTHRQALDFIAEMRRYPDTARIEIAQRMAQAFTPRAGKAALFCLRDLHAAASAVLSGTLDDAGIAQLQQILDLTATIRTPFPPGSRGEHWEKYYRLKVDAIDLPLLAAPALQEDAETPLTFCTGQGVPLDWSGVRAVAERQGARAVFFVAADEGYVARYAKLYATTILIQAGIRCLVIVHVIGGAAKLPAIAASVGISDPQLIFAGDSFNAAALKTRVIDSPFDTPPTAPVTYFQSVRFLQLGAVLRHLNLPVLVSDIDTLLQRGVSDLLETHAQADAVLNENSHALSLADRLTANLVLVNPTANGFLFARFLRSYLARHLYKPEVVRWIDQIALLLARHYLGRHNARIGAFDTKTDINNVMYPTYARNPYRFLSLYQGFDMASLDGLLQTKLV